MPACERSRCGTSNIDDPKADTKPFTARLNYRLNADMQLIEFVCIDKDAQHYVGADHPSNQK